MSSPLQNLVKIISEGVETLESAYDKDGRSFPSLNDPFTPTPLDGNTKLRATAQVVAAAAAQLLATVRAPVETLQDYTPGMYTSAALGIVVESNVADILKAAGPEGMHVKEIAAEAGIEATYLARIIRYLAIRHVFREVTPNVFANNRISSLLIKAKSLHEIRADPDARYDGALAAAFVGHFCDEDLSSIPYLSSFLHDPKGAAAPFNMHLGRPTRMWEWFEEAGNTWRARRFAATMKGVSEGYPPSIFTDGIDWKSFKKDGVVVDIGGSIGTVTLLLAQAFPHLRYVVQDLDKVIVEAHKFWQTSYPEAIASGLVTLQPHDFFNPQPIKGAAVYFMRTILHDWPETDVHRILTAIRAAAGPSSKLVVFDYLMPYACENTKGPSVSGPPVVPAPLLPNAGPGMDIFISMVDMHMMNLLGGQERTVDEFAVLGKATGWKLEAVKPGPMVTVVFTPDSIPS